MKTHRAWRARAQKGGANWQRARVAVEQALRGNVTDYQATVLAARIVKAHRDTGAVRAMEEIVEQELGALDMPEFNRDLLGAQVVEAFVKGLGGKS